MELADGTTLYWFISVGLMIGMITELVIGNEGIPLSGNLLWGTVSAVIMGHIGLYMGIGDGVFFSFLGTLPFLFLVNVFHQHHLADMTDDVDPGTTIMG